MSERGAKWLARRVRELRGERELTPAELADASGLSVAEITAVESGEASAPLSTLRALAKGFGLQLSQLFQGLDGLRDEPSLGARVRTCRRARRLTLGALATKTGLDREMLEQIEAGTYEPDLDMLRALARALGKSVAELLEVE